MWPSEIPSKKTCPQNSGSSVIFSFKVWKIWPLNLKKKNVICLCWTGRKGGRLFEGDRRVRYSVLVPNPISCPTEKKTKKTRLSFAWVPVKEISRALRRKAGKSASTSRGRPVNRSCVWSPALNSAVKSRPVAATIFMSHVGVSPKLPGGSSRFLLPLAGSRVVRVFSSAGTQRELLFILFYSPFKTRPGKFSLLCSQTAQLIWMAWRVVSPTTDLKWPWSHATADLMLKPSGRDRAKTSPPRIHSTDPAQPMKRAAPSSNLFARGLR